MPDTNPGLITLFAEALDRSDPADRAAYLDRASAGDAALRAQVEELLAAHAGAGRFLEPDRTRAPESAPADAPGDRGTVDLPSGDAATGTFGPAAHLPKSMATGDFTPAEAAGTSGGTPPRREVSRATTPGAVIAGRYTLVEVIGEGGMGSVYLAEQAEPVKRQVALKLIKAGMDSKAVLARFDAERQALALMDHPNIARIYDGGVTPAGQPFFVMELVQGVPLAEYCDSKRLTVDARLQLFVAVCQAVQHAHQKGIIHRDLKPGNVLVTEVDGKPTPKVIDFGVAKATEQNLTDQSVADTGAIVGTPAYMSPEQADPSSMDIDTRTDVYALGVILYELLTGSPPIETKQFKRGAVLEMLRMVREVDPPKPSTKVSTSDALPSIAATRGVEPAQLKRALHGDLDWIVMKALEKDRTRRYETANGFAADVLRHLAHEPVIAAPPSRAYRARKFVRKNRGLVTAASVVALALLVGLVGTAWGLIEAKRQEGLARDEAVEKDKERKRADTNLTDMLASRGLLAQEKDGQAEAALWFAAAADQAGVAGDDDRRRFNRVRARNALRQAPVPLAALELDGFDLTADERKWIVRLDFQPGGDLLLCRVGSERALLWSWRDGRTLPWVESLSGITAFCFSPDGADVALGFSAGDVQVRRVADGHLTGVEKLSHPITSLAYSPDGRLLAIGADRLRLWDAGSQSLLKPVAPHPAPVTALRFNRAGSRLVTVSGGAARVFAVAPGVQVLTPLYDPVPHALSTPPALTDADRTLVTVDRWVTRRGLESGTLLSRPGRANAIDGSGILSPNGDWVAVVKGDNLDRRVEIQPADERRPAVRLNHGHLISGIAVNSAGDTLLTSCHDGAARLWSMPDGRPIGPPLEHSGGWMLACALSADGRLVATVEYDVVRIWQRPSLPPAAVVDAWGYQPRLSFDGRLVTPGCWHEGPLNPKSFSSRQLQVVRSDDGRPAGPGIPLDGELTDTCLLAGNRTVAAIWLGMKFGVWDVATGKAVVAPVTLPSEAYSLAARPESTHVAVLCRSHLVVIDSQTGRTVLQLARETDGNHFMFVRYTPDGKTLIYRDEGTISVWDADTGRLRFPPLRAFSWFTFAVSPDSRWLAASTWRQVAQVWDLATGEAVSPPLPHPESGWGIFSLQFSPDGRRLLSAHKDGQVRYWDWKEGRLACPPLTHTDEVYAAAVTPDGRFAVTAVRGRPWRVEVWELTTGKRVAPPVRLPRDVGLGCASLALTPDGRRALVASQEGHLAVVDLEPLVADPASPTAEWARQAELATHHRLDAGDLNRLPLGDWKLRWATLPGSSPQRPWAQLSATPVDPKRVDERLLSYLNERLKQRPEDLAALYQRWRLLRADGDKTRLTERCQRTVRGGVDEDAASVLADFLPADAADIRWSPLAPAELTAQQGTSLTPEPDGWVLARVTTPAAGTYRVRGDSGLRRITALRLEVKPHAALPGPGAGSAGGNFHLTGVRAYRHRPGREPVPLPLVSGDASAVRLGGEIPGATYGPDAVLDDSPRTRWDVYPHANDPNWLQLYLREPVALADGEQVVVELDSRDEKWVTNHLGHFRLLVSGEERLAGPGLRLTAVQPLPASGTLKLAAAYLDRGETDQAQAVLAGFPKPLFPLDHLLHPLLQTALHRRLDRPPQARDAYDRLLAGLRDHVPPAPLRPAVLDAMTAVGGLPRTSATRTLALLSAEAGVRQQTMSPSHLTDTPGVVRGMAALAWFGQLEQYNAMRDRLLAVAEGTDDATIAEEVTEACCLRPADAARRSAAVALGRRAVARNADPAALAWKRLVLGMAEYRGEQFADAIESLTAAATAAADIKRVRGIAAFYRAMSLFRLGKADEARKLAADAARAMPPLPSDDDQVFGEDPYDIIAWLAYKEAKALIRFDDPPPTPKPTLPPEKK